MTEWLRWALLPAACVHTLEEFVFPGGFPAWYRGYRPDPSRITPRFLVIINIALVAVCLNVGLIRHDPAGVPFWLVISALLCANGCWHGWASYKTRAYSPGMITGLMIYLPLAVYGYIKVLGSCRFRLDGNGRICGRCVLSSLGCCVPQQRRSESVKR